MADSFVTPDMLATFRGMTEGAMPDTATMRLPGTWVDEGGGAGHSAPGDEVSFPCRLVATKNATDIREILIAGQLDVMGTVTMYYPLTVEALNPDQHIRVVSATFGNHECSVVGIPPLSSYSVHRVALLRIVNEGEE
jgi:hypothetical protein